jgi:hypothetical protein
MAGTTNCYRKREKIISCKNNPNENKEECSEQRL